ncbi:hypothetical protein ACTFIU_008044 [Dictyostelium citrinum]
MESYAHMASKINTCKIINELNFVVHKTQKLKRNYVYMINIKDEVTSKLRDDLLKSINNDTERLIFSNGFFKELTDSKPTVIKIMNLFDSQMKGLHSATIRPKNCFTNFKWKYSIEMVEETLANNGIEIIKTTQKGNTLKILSFNNISQVSDKKKIIDLEYITMICYKNKNEKLNENPITENSEEVNKEPTTNTQPQQKPKKQTTPKKEKPNKEPTTTSNENQNEQLDLSPATSETKDKPTTTIHDEKLVTKTTESNSLEFLNISAINEFKEESRIVESSPTIESIDNQSLLNINVKVETPTIQAPLIQPTNIHKPEFLPQWNLETSTTQNQTIDDSIFQSIDPNYESIYKSRIDINRVDKTPKKPVFNNKGNLKRKTLDQSISEALSIKDLEEGNDDSSAEQSREDQNEERTIDAVEDRLNAALQKVDPKLPTIRLRNKFN